MPESATLEAPATAKPNEGLVNMGDIFRKSLGDANGEPPNEAAPKEAAAKESAAVIPPEKKEPSKKETAKSGLAEALIGDKKEAAPEKVEPDPLAEIGDGKTFNPKKAREIIETHKKSISERDAELEKLRKTADSHKDYADIKQRLEQKDKEAAQLKDAITALNVEYDPEFREKYVTGRQKLLDKALARVKENGGDPDGFADAMKLTGKRRTEALKESLSEVDDIDKPRILSVLDQIQQLDDERSDLQKDPQQAWDRIERERKEALSRHQAEAEKLKSQTFETVLRQLPDKFPLARILDGSVEGASKHNEIVNAAIERAQSRFNPGTPPEIIVENQIKAELSDYLWNEYLSEHGLRVAAEKQLAEYDGAEPKIRGSGKPAAQKELTPGEKYRAALEAGKGD